MLAVAVILPLLLAAGAAVVAMVAGGPQDRPAPPAAPASEPLVLPAVPAPAAGSPECDALVAALPSSLPSGPRQLDRRQLAEPAPESSAAWGTDPVVVLRCGIERPAELTPIASLLQVSDVRWLPLPGENASGTWVAVDRPVYVAVTMPNDAGTGPLQEVSKAISSTLVTQPVQPLR